MTVLAAACGIMIALLGLWSIGGRPTDGQLAVEIVCLVGGLILCFQAVILSNLSGLSRRLEAFEEPQEFGEERLPQTDQAHDQNEDDGPVRGFAFPTIRTWKALLRLR